MRGNFVVARETRDKCASILSFCAPCMVGATPPLAGPKMGIQQDAPTIETIVPLTFCEIIDLKDREKKRGERLTLFPLERSEIFKQFFLALAQGGGNLHNDLDVLVPFPKPV